MALNDLSVFEEPICLIYSDDNGHLCIKDEVLKEIGSLSQTFHIVTITGLCRSGKSYLMNRLAKVKKAFPLGSSIESQTKGIWVWCRPHPVHKNDILILLDTEGVGDIKKGDTNHDNRILAIAVLLSSTLIYNIQGTMRDNDLQMLSYVTEVCRQITTSMTAQNEVSVDVDVFYPMLVLTLRDFSLELTKDGSKIETDSYLNDFCLKTLQGNGEKERNYNETRQCIEKYFKMRKCFTFDRPGDRTTLQNLETIEDTELSKDFIHDSKEFVEYVLNQDRPKRLDAAHTMRGSSFATLVTKYIEVIRNGCIPNVQNVLSATVETENRKAVEDCCKLYISEMQSLQLPTTDEQSLLDYHERCKKKAIDHFMTKCIRDDGKKYYEEANTKIQEEYNRHSLKNDVESEKCCNKVLCELYRIMQKKLNDNVYLRSGGSDDYESDLKVLKDNYSCKVDLGCKKKETLQQFLSRIQNEGEMIKQADQTMTNKETELKVAIKTASLLEKEKAELESQAKQSDEQLRNLFEQLSYTNNKLKDQQEKHKTELDLMQTTTNNTIMQFKELQEIEMKNMQEKYTKAFEEGRAQQELIEKLQRVTDTLQKQIKEKEEENVLLKSVEVERLKLQTELQDIKEMMQSNNKKYELLLENTMIEKKELESQCDEIMELSKVEKGLLELRNTEISDSLKDVKKQFDEISESNEKLKNENTEQNNKIVGYENRTLKLPQQESKWCSLL